MNLVVGTAQFGMRYGITNVNQLKYNELIKIKKFIKNKKISFLDTSQSYGNSEKYIKELEINDLKIFTKIKIPNKKKKNIYKECCKKLNLSLKKIGVKKIFCVLLQDPKDAKSKDIIQYVKSFKILKNKKLINYFGVSIYEPRDIVEILKIWKPDIIQIPANIFDHRFLNKKIVSKLKKHKIKIMVRSCFLQGLLVDKEISSIKFKKFKKNFNKFFNWCDDKNISYLKACLHFLRSFKFIDYIVVGINSRKHLEEIYKEKNSKKIKIPNYFKFHNLNVIDPRRW